MIRNVIDTLWGTIHLHGKFKVTKIVCICFLFGPSCLILTNKLFRSENPDPAKHYEGLDVLVRSVLLRVVLKEHAVPTSEGEKHLLHICACNFVTFLGYIAQCHESKASGTEETRKKTGCRWK